MKLRIELETPLCSGSGLSRPAGVDRDVVFDAFGLPWIPARRLKGLLRDALRELRVELGTLGASLPCDDDIFGARGAKDRGTLALGNARLENYGKIKPWFAAFVPGNRGPDRRTAVMDALSSVRRQTAMDRHTGAPKQDTLRATRVINPGLVFEADIHGGLPERHCWTLALAAAALREMGSSRARGLGRVRCAVFEDSQDLTAVALKNLTPDSFSPGAWPASPAAPPKEAPPPPTPQIQSGTLAFSLLLEEPAVFPELSGDPNTVSTAPYIPGAAIHGWFANRYLRAKGDAPNDRFRELFTSGSVRFGNAYFADPAPHSLRVRKNNPSEAIDLISEPGSDVRRGQPWLQKSAFQSGTIIWDRPDCELHYHHERAADPRLKRAVGLDQAERFNLSPEQAGAFFQYESLSPGQRFHGEIHGDGATLGEIAALVDSGVRLELGRSRSAQYGGQAIWNWEAPPTPSAPAPPSAELTIVALSPVLGRAPEGHPAPCFPLAELVEELGLPLEPLHEFCRTDWHGGYLAHQRLPKSQAPAWAIGSVLVVRSDSGSIDAAAIARASARSYGRRVELGFGRIRITPGKGVARSSQLTVIDRPEAQLPDAIPPLDGVTAELAQKIFFAQTTLHAAAFASEQGRFQSSRVPPKSLLHRLRLMCESQDEDTFRKSLRALRKRALAHLDRCQIENLSLLRYLEKDRAECGKRFAHEVWEASPVWAKVFPSPPFGRAADGKTFYLELLATLAREARRQPARPREDC